MARFDPVGVPSPVARDSSSPARRYPLRSKFSGAFDPICILSCRKKRPLANCNAGAKCIDIPDILASKQACLMNRYTATPFTQHHGSADLQSVIHLFRTAADDHHLLARDEYLERPAQVVDGLTPKAVLASLSVRWQNTDDQSTPDNGPSLQTGDLVRLEDEHQAVTWWIMCMFGWAQTGEPAKERRLTSTWKELSDEAKLVVMPLKIPTGTEKVLFDELRSAARQMDCSFLIIECFTSTPRAHEELSAIPPEARDHLSHTGYVLLRATPAGIDAIIEAIWNDVRARAADDPCALKPILTIITPSGVIAKTYMTKANAYDR